MLLLLYYFVTHCSTPV